MTYFYLAMAGTLSTGTGYMLHELRLRRRDRDVMALLERVRAAGDAKGALRALVQLHNGDRA